MVMPPRLAKRRGGNHRWLAIPLVLTMLVLLVDASLHARSNNQQVALSADIWLDRALPQIAASTEQGVELSDIMTGKLPQGARAAVAQLAEVARAAGSTYKAVAKQDAPSSLATSSGLLLACLYARQQGAELMAGAARSLVDRGKKEVRGAEGEMATAIADFQLGDSSYALFASRVPGPSRMPPSRWVPTGGALSPSTYEAFAVRLAGAPSRSAPHQLVIDAISTQPVALSTQGNYQVLPPSASLGVTVVVSNTGTSGEKGVTVSASLSAARGGGDERRSARVDIPAGTATTVELSGLAIKSSTPSIIEVSAIEPQGEPGSASRSLDVETAGNNFDATTTTAPASTSTTLSGLTGLSGLTSVPGPTTAAVTTTTVGAG